MAMPGDAVFLPIASENKFYNTEGDCNSRRKAQEKEGEGRGERKTGLTGPSGPSLPSTISMCRPAARAQSGWYAA